MGRTAAVLLLFVAAGCFPKAANLRPGALWDRVRTGSPPAGGLVLQTALVERPAGDEYLSRGLWATAGRPVPHELATLLARNGIRVGVVSGIPTGEFAALRDAGADTDGAPLAAMNRTFRPGVPRVVPVNGPLGRADLFALADLAAEPRRLSLNAVECGLNITATPAAGDQVRLRCEFQVQHGEKQAFLKVSAEDVDLSRLERKPLEQFPALAFSVTLSPGDTLIVGPTDTPLDTLGGAFFIDPTPARPRQRALVVSAGRPAADPAPTARTTAVLHAAGDR